MDFETWWRDSGAGTYSQKIVAKQAWQAATSAECERICAAIKAEDDHCVDGGDYMLDSDDCIAVAKGEWKRPDFGEHLRSNA